MPEKKYIKYGKVIYDVYGNSTTIEIEIEKYSSLTSHKSQDNALMKSSLTVSIQRNNPSLEKRSRPECSTILGRYLLRELCFRLNKIFT